MKVNGFIPYMNFCFCKFVYYAYINVVMLLSSHTLLNNK